MASSPRFDQRPAPTVLPAPVPDDNGQQMTGEAVGLDLRPTSFILRAAGAIIDFSAYLALLLLTLYAISLPVISDNLDSAGGAAVTVIAVVFCLFITPAIVETATQGKSLGKLATGARIVRDDGGSISFRHAFIRALTAVLENFATLGGIASMVALLNDRAKRLGDLLAGTYSQNERISKKIPTVFPVPPELLAWASIADVATMPDGLSRRIAQFLRQADRLTPDARGRLARSLAGEASAFVSPLPDCDAALFLAGVSAVRRGREGAALQLESDRLEHLRSTLEGLPGGFPER